MGNATRQSVMPEDCRLGMRALGDGTVSLVLTDPPYFTDGMDDGWSHETLRRRRDRSNGAVGGLPGGMKFDPAQGRRLQAFLAPIAAEWMRVVKPGGFVLCFSQPRLVHRMAVAIEDAGFEVRDLYVWRYGDGQCKAFSQDHFIRRMNIPESEKARLIGELGGRKTPQLKPQMETVVMAQAPREGTYAENWLAHRVGLVDMSAGNNLLEAGRVPGTIMPARKPREKYGHMTVKPVELLRHLIRLFTGADALVLDPFAGTGSTGVAAKLEGRAFAGFEIDRAMSGTANARIGETACGARGLAGGGAEGVALRAAGTEREAAMSGGGRKAAARALRRAAGAAAALALAAGAADARPRTLGQDESRALLAGNTVYGYNPRNDDTFKMFHSTDGGVRAELRNVNGRVSESAGRWWITGEGKFCVDWANYRWIDSCTSVVQDGDAVSFVDDSGRIVSFAEVAPGNPDDL